MPQCKVIRIKKKKFCIGDFNQLIKIKSREMATPSTSVDFSQDFETLHTVWAGLETVEGRNAFYVTNINSDIEVTHVFYMRWIPGLTAEHWIEHTSENYDILRVDNTGEYNQWAVCYCNVRGTVTEAVNDA